MLKQEQQLPSPQLLNQVSQFIKQQGNRNYFCLFLLGSQSGLRVSEAVNFDLSLKKNKNLYLIQGKRHKKRSIYVSPAVVKELKTNHWQPNQTNRFSFAHFLQKVKKELNISPNIELTPHTLRRCFTTYQAISGMPLPVLQKVLGHASIRTTALYWKATNTIPEKEYREKWLEGKPTPKPKDKDLRDKWQLFINIQQTVNIFLISQTKNSDQKITGFRQSKLLEATKAKNQTLQDKNNSLTQELAERDKTIANLENDLQTIQKELASEQAKNHQLELLLVAEKAKVSTLIKQNQEKFATDNQLIAQIEIPTKK